jgi:acetoin utilization protein AcuB
MMLSVSDLMTLGPVTVKPDATLREVLALMKAEGCRQLLVEDEAGKLVGIITDRDVRLAMNSPIVLHERWQDEELLNHATAASCMTREPINIAPDTPAYRAAEMLATYKFGALPVVDGDALVGIISVTDLLEQFAEEHRADVLDEEQRPKT